MERSYCSRSHDILGHHKGVLPVLIACGSFNPLYISCFFWTAHPSVRTASGFSEHANIIEHGIQCKLHGVITISGSLYSLETGPCSSRITFEAPAESSSSMVSSHSLSLTFWPSGA